LLDNLRDGKMRLLKRTFSIRAAMLLLVWGGVAVMLAMACAAGWLSYREYRDRIGSSLIAASRALVFAIDNELDEPLAFVNGLSASNSFSKGDFHSFRTRMEEKLAAYGYVVFIKSADGQENIEATNAGTGRALRLGKAAKSYLRRIDGRWIALIDVPIEVETGQNLYTLVVGVPSHIFQDVLTAQHFPPTWTSVILDADWMIVARDVNPEKFIGNRGGGEEFRNAPTDQTHEVRLVTGASAMSAHTHSTRYGWTTAIAITEADLFNQALGPVLLAAIGSFIATGAVIVMAAFFSTYLAGAIGALAQMVRGFPEGALRSKPVFRVREISLVAQSVHEAAVAVVEARKVADQELNDTRRLNELSTLLVGEGTSFETCLDKIIDTTVVVSGAHKGNIQLFNSTSGSLTIAAQKGFEKDFLTFFATMRDASAACTAAMHEKKQIVVEDVLTSDIFVGQPAQKVLLDAAVRGVVSTPLMSSKGSLLGMISIHYTWPGKPSERQLRLINILARQAADYLERKQSEQTHQTILRELQHRSNNLLAVIQSLAHRSLEKGAAKEAFEARLQALARANRALLRSSWGGAYLDQLVRTELEAFSKRAAIYGPSVMLPPQTAQNFTLALHELATNSAKHGSLSASSGKLAIAWAVRSNASGSVLNFEWQESDGPPVGPPARQGFGTMLLKSVFPDVRLEYAAKGLRCEIEVPLVVTSPESPTQPLPVSEPLEPLIGAS
jgi:two-component sensor histidine kinase